MTDIPQARPRQCRCAIVIAVNTHEALTALREIAHQTMRERRLRVIQGDDKRRNEYFPTRETRAWVQRFHNRFATSERIKGSPPQIAFVFYNYYPILTTEANPYSTAHRLAQDVGFGAVDIRIESARNAAELQEVVRRLGVADPRPADTPTTLVEALQYFAREYRTDAVVSARALESARDWRHPDPDRVLQDLRAVHRIYGRWLDSSGRPIEARDRRQFLSSERGITLHYESEATIRQYRTATPSLPI